ncbi:hypothetical protein ACGFJT_42055 [Actinomadura geliboluensis]|uniref:hypothetical protein n=1 Tax=Actinomadura geliboluensis TaxID=882440 RepID=UPI00371FB343
MSGPWPDRYQQLLRALAATAITLTRREPRPGDMPADEWPYAAQPALAARGLLEEALIADARFTGDTTLACPPLPQHVVLARAARSASELIKAASHSTSPSQWASEPTTSDLYGHRDRADQALRTVASRYRTEHERSQRPGLSPSQTRLATAHLNGLDAAADALAASLADTSGFQHTLAALTRLRERPRAPEDVTAPGAREGPSTKQADPGWS